MLERGQVVVSFLGGLVSGLPMAFAAQLPWLRDLAALLAIATSLMALGGGLLTLFVYRMARKMLDESEKEAKLRHDELRKEVQGIGRLLGEYVTKYDTVSKRVEKMDRQLENGQKEFFNLRERLAVMESGGHSRRFRRDDDDDADI